MVVFAYGRDGFGGRRTIPGPGPSPALSAHVFLFLSCCVQARYGAYLLKNEDEEILKVCICFSVLPPLPKLWRLN